MRRRRAIIGPTVLAGGALYVLDKSGPITYGADINPVSAASSLVLLLAGTSLASSIFGYAADLFEKLEATTPTGAKGKGGFATSLWHARKDVRIFWGWGTYFGTFAKGWWFFSRNRPVIAPMESPALILGPNGSGKDTRFIQPGFCADPNDSIYIDIKGDECPVATPAMERQGRKVIKLNLGGVFEDIIGPTDYYNPLHIIADNYEIPGGLENITEDCTEISNILSPEPTQKSGSSGENKFFREGERDLEAIVSQQVILVYGKRATLGHVGELINDREALFKEMLWVCGRLRDKDGNHLPPMPIEGLPWVKLHDPEDVEVYIRHYRSKASGIADMLKPVENRTMDSFLSGARQALAPFNPTTRAHKIMSRSSFRFADLKEGKNKTSVFIIPDATRLAAQNSILGLLQWSYTTELRRHRNKRRKVSVYYNECTNYTVYQAGTAMTINRGFGIVDYYVFQSISAFRGKYGDEAWGTVMSETKAKLFLPGQRDQFTLELLEKMLSHESIMMKGRNGRKYTEAGIDGFNYSEDSKPVMSAEEIRRTDKAILFLGQNRPLLLNMPSIASIAPWRKQVGGNPYHDCKPYLERVKLRIGRRDGGPLVRLFKALFNHLKPNGETS